MAVAPRRSFYISDTPSINSTIVGICIASDNCAVRLVLPFRLDRCVQIGLLCRPPDRVASSFQCLDDDACFSMVGNGSQAIYFAGVRVGNNARSYTGKPACFLSASCDNRPKGSEGANPSRQGWVALGVDYPLFGWRISTLSQGSFDDFALRLPVAPRESDKASLDRHGGYQVGNLRRSASKSFQFASGHTVSACGFKRVRPGGVVCSSPNLQHDAEKDPASSFHTARSIDHPAHTRLAPDALSFRLRRRPTLTNVGVD